MKLMSLLVLISLLGYVVSQPKTCQCSDYGTQLGCTNWATGCYWYNNACVSSIPNCSELTQNDCGAPSCYFDDTKQTCNKFTLCNQIDLSNLYGCKSYGCIPDDLEVEFGICKSAFQCSTIKSQNVCDNLNIYGSGETCAWNTGLATNTTASCISVTKCQGLPADVCNLKPYCALNGKNCGDATCKGLDQAGCGHTKSLCLWIGIIKQGVSAGSEALGKCIKNDCSAYGSGNCNMEGNYNFCAWNGKACQQCYDSSAKLVSIVATLFFLMIMQ